MPMISRLTGTVIHTDLRYLIVDVGTETGSVGYKVFATGETIASTMGIGQSKPGASKVTLWTYLAVRDDALDLYGFASLAELRFFELLLTVSGIGPKTALGILNIATVSNLATAIQTSDASHLTKVSGIGKKNAEKIVRELEGKLDDVEFAGMMGASAAAADGRSDADVIAALVSLGYRDTDARDVLKKIDKTLIDTGARVKAALKLLS
jgi:holliday junction DNA helicase RuvA